METFERHAAAVRLKFQGGASVRCSTIDADAGAGDVGGCRRKHVGDGGRYLCFRSKALQRHVFGEFVELLLHFRRVGIKTARHDPAGSDCVHADTRGRPFAGGCLRQCQHSAARRRRMAELRPAVPDVGDDIHDGAAIRLHPAVIDLAHEDEAAGQVVAHHGLEPLGRDRLQRGAKLTTGIVDQAVDTTVSREHRVNGADHHGLITDVTGIAHRLSAILLDLPLNLAKLLNRPTEDHHVRAEGGEFMGRATANPAATAGHDDRLLLEQTLPEHRLIWHFEVSLTSYPDRRGLRCFAASIAPDNRTLYYYLSTKTMGGTHDATRHDCLRDPWRDRDPDLESPRPAQCRHA